MARKPSPIPSSFDGIADWVLRDADSTHVVVGPVLWQPSDGTAGKVWYFIVASSEAGRGFRCDQVVVPAGSPDWMRSGVIAALMRRPPLVVHSVDDELAMVRLCEMLWPGGRIAALRRQVEAERRGEPS
jgi:hypothetical protein